MAKQQRRGGAILRPSCSAARNVLHGVLMGQLTGRTPRSLRALPAPVQKRLESQTRGMARQCLELEAKWQAGELEACRSLVSTIYRTVRDSPSHSQQRSRDSFVLCGAEVLFIRVLSTPVSEVQRPLQQRQLGGLAGGLESTTNLANAGAGRAGLWPHGGALGALGVLGAARAGTGGEGWRGGRTQPVAGGVRPIAERLRGMDIAAGSMAGVREERVFWQMRADCLAALRELCFSSPLFSESLSCQRDFLVRLFVLMEHPATFENAVGLAEEMLAVAEETLSLREVHNFQQLVKSLSSRQLAFFCRVLAMVVFEPEDRAPEVSALQGDNNPVQREEREAEWAVADSNHDVLLDIPEILPSLVRILQGDERRQRWRGGVGSQEWEPLLGDGGAGDAEDLEDDGEEEEEEEEDEEEDEDDDMADATLTDEEDEEDDEEEEEQQQGEGGREMSPADWADLELMDQVLSQAGLTIFDAHQRAGRNSPARVLAAAARIPAPEGAPVGGGPSVRVDNRVRAMQRPGEAELAVPVDDERPGASGVAGLRNVLASAWNILENGDRPGVLPGAGDSRSGDGRVLNGVGRQADARRGPGGGGGQPGRRTGGPLGFLQGLLGWSEESSSGSQPRRTGLWGGLFGGSGGQESTGRRRPSAESENGRTRAGPSAAGHGGGAAAGGGLEALQRLQSAPVRGSAGGNPLFPRAPSEQSFGMARRGPVEPEGESRVFVFVGSPPRLLGEVTEAELGPMLRNLPQGAVTILRPGDVPGLDETNIRNIAAAMEGIGNGGGVVGPSRTAAVQTVARARRAGEGGTAGPGAGEAAVAGRQGGGGRDGNEQGERAQRGNQRAARAQPGTVPVQRLNATATFENQAEVAAELAAGAALTAATDAGTAAVPAVAPGQQGAGPAGNAGMDASSTWRILSMHQVEVLFVLCALCGGKRKETVQDRLAELGLVDILYSMFERLNWSPLVPPEPHGIHGPGCACNPQSALKIQYLRLVHNFCDRDGANLRNKELLARRPKAAVGARTTAVGRTGSSPSLGGGAALDVGDRQLGRRAELLRADHVRRLASESDVSSPFAGTQDAAETRQASGFDPWAPLGPRISDTEPLASTSRGAPSGRGVRRRGRQADEREERDEGLILKIIKVLLKEPCDSVYRFWLASCVEAFLRGSNPRDQEYVAATGLMEHLVGEILGGAGAFKCAASLQIDFDLLGELIKFNPAMFRRLNQLLTAGDKFNSFIEVMVSHLVDSNVFIRSLMLSVHYFKLGSPAPPYLSSLAVANTSTISPIHARWAVTASKTFGHRSAESLMAMFESPRSGKSSARSKGKKEAPGWSEDLGSARESAEETWDECASWSSGSAGGSSPAIMESLAGCQLTDFMHCNSVRLLIDLMAVVRLGDINQDNICVLNTALIFFIFANRSGQMLQFLEAVREADCFPKSPGGSSPLSYSLMTFSHSHSSGFSPDKLGGSCSTMCVLRNFRSLLDFWKEYYLRRRGRDCASLQYSTNIPFSEWLHVVHLLCEPPDCPTSLLYSPLVGSSTCAPSSVPVGVAPLRRC